MIFIVNHIYMFGVRFRVRLVFFLSVVCCVETITPVIYVNQQNGVTTEFCRPTMRVVLYRDVTHRK